MKPLAHGGLALATSLSSGVNVILLVWALKKRLGRIGARDILGSVFRATASSAVMGAVVFFAVLWTVPSEDASFWHLLVWVAGTVLAGALLYGACAYLFKSREVSALVGMLRTRLSQEHG